jgi:hypothetical protein
VLDATLRTTIGAACGTAVVAHDDVLAAEGLGFDDLTEACAERGFASLVDAATIAECVRGQHACQTDQLIELEIPRLRELLGLGAVTLP